MKGIIAIFIKSVVSIATLSSCDNASTHSIQYPFPRPDSLPIPFMPGIVTSRELDFNSCYSPDGKSFYFGRSENKKWVMYVTAYNGNNWTTPVHPSFIDTSFSEADPMFAPDGNLYYISSRPRNREDTISDYDIWMVRPLGNNQWSEPANVEIANSDSNEFYISFAANGNMYFSSARKGGLGQEDIYFCKYEDGRYAAPANLGGQVNSTGSDHDPLITRDEGYLIFSSSERKDSYGQADLYFSKRNSKNEWLPILNLGARFNTATYEYCSYLTPDNRFFFYSTEKDIKWISAEYLFKDMNSKLTSSPNHFE